MKSHSGSTTFSSEVTRRPTSLYFLALFGLLAVAGSLLFTVYNAGNLAAAPDFYVQWHGTKVALSGGNPYSDAATLETQLYLRGAPALPQDDQLPYVYSLFSVYLTAPFLWLPYELAASIWMGLLLAGNCLGSVLLLDALDWKPRPLPLLALLLVVLFSAPFAACVLLGQWAAFVYAMLCLVVWGLRRGHDSLAGVALALAPVKPTLVVLVLGGCLLWGVAQRRWRFLAGFSLTMLPLLAVSLLQQPQWINELLRVTSIYRTFKRVLTGTEFLFDGLPGSIILGWGLWLILALWLVYSWYLAMRRGTNETFIFAFALTLVMTLLLLPQTNVINSIILMLPFLMVLRPIERRVWLWLLWPLPLIVGSWFLHLVVFKTAYGWSIITLPYLLLPFLFWHFRQNFLTKNSA